MIQIVTHSGNFHPDDVFAVATLQLYLGDEHTEVKRSRETMVIEAADWVIDVGGEYDPRRKRFDHHQNGAPVRDNGIPYAAFGLIWKELGEKVAGSMDIALRIDEYLVQPIDAGDNGVTLYSLSELQVKPYELYSVINSFKPVWGTNENVDSTFMSAVRFARELLERHIAHGKAALLKDEVVQTIYETAPNKIFIVTNEDVSARAFSQYPEVLFVVAPDEKDTIPKWTAGAVPITSDVFETRVYFPQAWAGLRSEELVVASGIEGAIFCHKNRHLLIASTKEGAIAAVEKALQGKT